MELPSELNYLRLPAYRFAKDKDDVDVYQFAMCVAGKELEQLQQLAQEIRSKNHYTLINLWLKDVDWEECELPSLIYTLIGILDALGLEFW